MSKSFRKYWKARPSGDELDKVFAEMRGESSRAAVLVGTAMLEDVLRGVVAFKCMHLTETEKADLLDGTPFRGFRPLVGQYLAWPTGKC
jgi:hypothetical protein